MDPPSPELVRTLQSLNLATLKELRSCRRIVQKFAKGLPAYDSVWLDALVRLGQLTPYQARKLEQRQADELRIGDRAVLRAQRHFDQQFPLFAAVENGTGRPLLVAKVTAHSGTGNEVEKRLQKSLSQINARRAQFPDAPVDFVRQQETFFILSPFRPGESLARYLVRRGRFPESVVRGLAKESLNQLAGYDSTIPHGDLRLSNFWLTPGGNVTIWNAGILSAFWPEITIHTPLPQDSFDGMAPERIETGMPATLTSDIYALGCVWWQLLTGRPPFTLADPLACLTAHRNRRIADVRTIAPETSAPLAELILKMTAPDPERRPTNYGAIQEQLADRDRGSQSRVRNFVKSFESSAPRRATPKTRTALRPVTVAVAVLLFLGAGLTAWNRDRLGLPSLQNLTAAVEQAKATPRRPDQVATNTSPLAPSTISTDQPDNHSTAATTALPLPAPDAEGVVRLSPKGVYAAGPLSVPERLTLMGDATAPATILVDAQPLQLEAGQLHLENVRIQRNPSVPPALPTVQIVAQELLVNRIIASAESSTSTEKTHLHWRVRNTADPRAGRLRVANSTFTGGTALQLGSPLSSALLQNVLKVDSGALIDLQGGVPADWIVTLQLNHCTLRNSGPAVRMPDGGVLSRSGQLSLRGMASVFDLAPGSAMIEFPGDLGLVPWQPHLDITGQGLLCQREAVLIAGRSTPQVPIEPFHADDIPVSGLILGTFHFEGEIGESNAGNRLVWNELSTPIPDILPGVDPTALLAPQPQP
ncbi:serine/threonine protein kinase [Planctomicrobium sp. SH664]|uniref:serine/threonine protein kinase n=1 Tax=Planctomicrobium sp. SH664 TaxID=3448125 RepID=UPI003F5C5794